MDINLCGIADVQAASKPATQLHVRDEDGYYARFGAEWRALLWAREAVAMVVRMRRAVPTVGYTGRLAHS